MNFVRLILCLLRDERHSPIPSRNFLVHRIVQYRRWWLASLYVVGIDTCEITLADSKNPLDHQGPYLVVLLPWNAIPREGEWWRGRYMFVGPVINRNREHQHAFVLLGRLIRAGENGETDRGMSRFGGFGVGEAPQPATAAPTAM